MHVTCVCKLKPDKVFAWKGEMDTNSHTSAEELLAIASYRRRDFFLRMWTNMLAQLQWTAAYPGVHGQHKLDSVCLREEDTKLCRWGRGGPRRNWGGVDRIKYTIWNSQRTNKDFKTFEISSSQDFCNFSSVKGGQEFLLIAFTDVNIWVEECLFNALVFWSWPDAHIHILKMDS